MKTHWATAMVEMLQKIDRDEAPHGLYGLRQARKTSERLPKLSPILSGPSIRLVQRIGGALHVGRPSSDSIAFGLAGPRKVFVSLRSYADTKVRKFGSAYHLDKMTSVFHDPIPDLISEVPKLAESARGNYGLHEQSAYSFGLLFIGHFQKEKDGIAMLDKTIHSRFLNRYELSHTAASWEDAHGRGFHSMISLWYIDQPLKI